MKKQKGGGQGRGTTKKDTAKCISIAAKAKRQRKREIRTAAIKALYKSKLQTRPKSKT